MQMHKRTMQKLRAKIGRKRHTSLHRLSSAHKYNQRPDSQLILSRTGVGSNLVNEYAPQHEVEGIGHSQSNHSAREIYDVVGTKEVDYVQVTHVDPESVDSRREKD